MARTIAAAIARVLAADGGITHDVIDFYFTVNDGEDQVVWHFSDAKGITVNGLHDADLNLVDGVVYDNRIKTMPTIRHSLGKAADDATFEIENASLTFSGMLHETDRTVDGSICVISRAFFDASLYPAQVIYNASELIRGYITDYRPTDEIVRFTVTSDMSTRGRMIANRPLHELCPFRFNKNGVFTAAEDDCGWRLGDGLQAGASAITCDKTKAGDNGCIAHNIPWRFGGYDVTDPVAALTSNPTDPVGIGISGGGDNGWSDPVIEGWDRDTKIPVWKVLP